MCCSEDTSIENRDLHFTCTGIPIRLAHDKVCCKGVVIDCCKPGDKECIRCADADIGALNATLSGFACMLQ